MTVTREYVLHHFDEVCDRAERGEEIVLERPGKPSLTLASLPQIDWERRARAIEEIRAHMLAQPPLQGVTIRELLEEGRRY